MLSFINQAVSKLNSLAIIPMLFNRKWKSHLYTILPHSTEAKVWVFPSKTGFYLPHIYVEKNIFFSDIEVVQKAIEKELGIAINILYYASYSYDKSKRQIYSVYVLEQDGSVEGLSEGSWIDLETLQNLSLKIPEHKLIIEQYLTEVESRNIPELRPPWCRTGWYDSVTQWIDEELSKLNSQRLSPPECIKSWGISCILRIKTTKGNVYLKEASTLPLFCDEPIVTSELANIFPGHIPNVLSVNPQRHWMLLADFGESVGRDTSINIRKEVYQLFAQMQIKSVEHIDKLLNIGCLDRRLEKLATQIDVLFNDESALSDLKESEVERLRKIAPNLKNLCSQLAEYKIPQTIVHGDLHLGNVAVNQDSYLIFDWTDCCISHPFFDMFELLLGRNYNPFNSSINTLKNEYLKQWEKYESRSRLLEAWKIAKPLCALHHAVTYKYIVACLEPRAKQELNALPIFLRELLKCKV